MNPYNVNNYLSNQVNTASPEQLLLILYDGAIRFTRQAIIGIEQNKPEVRRHGVSKTMAILSEFSNTLNFEAGGEIAEDLDALYNFMIRELIQVNIDNNIEKLKVVEELLVDLRQTWGKAVEIDKKEKYAVSSAIPEMSDKKHHDGYTSLALTS